MCCTSPAYNDGMKKAFTWAAALLLVTTVLSASAFAQGRTKPSVTGPRSPEVISLPGGGKLMGDLYTNSEYKMELRIPQGFVLTTSTAEDDKRGAELMAGGDEKRRRALEGASAAT